MRRKLVLADGSVYEGEGFGSTQDALGEVVFTTGMSGYQESISDASYNGQIITFTYPLIGNTGINRDDNESLEPSCRAIVVRELARRPSNWRTHANLDDYLKQHKIVGLAGIDTRSLTKKIRSHGVLKGIIVDRDVSHAHAMARLEPALPIDQVKQVSTRSAFPVPGTQRRVVVIDYGLKHSILRELAKRHCDCVVLPHTASAEEVLALKPDGVMLTNGPGDPSDVPDQIDVIRQLMGQVPIFGICLGHQLMALANGASTYKMKFGHRGFNHPVRDLNSQRIGFTSQNHGYAVDPASIDPKRMRVTHREINDDTIEGLAYTHTPAFSVQFHPDATPGPHDNTYLFDEFMELIDREKEKRHA
jgi:carbamoyl-phosphate synthase small subunit